MATQERVTKRTIADLFPNPGQWTEGEYLDVSDRGQLVELSDGNIEILPMPNYFHQLISGRLFAALLAFIDQHKLGAICYSPLPVRLWPGKMREPDLMFMSAAHADRIQTQYWGVPDLAIEIISPGTETIDRETKRDEYAQAGIPEYWIIDPEAKAVELLRLKGESYETVARLTEDGMLASPTFPGFELSLKELFAKP